MSSHKGYGRKYNKTGATSVAATNKPSQNVETKNPIGPGVDDSVHATNKPSQNVETKNPIAKSAVNASTPYNCQELVAALKSLQHAVQCYACHKPMRSTRTCLNGHGICYNCKNRCSQYCPICRSVVLESKPAMLNDIIKLLPKNCPFLNKGCDSLVLANDNDHETFCKFRYTFCRLLNCGWKGMAKDLLMHLEKFHGKEIIRSNSQVTILMSFNTKNDRDGLAVIVAFNNIFWQHTKVRQTRLMQFYQYVPMDTPSVKFSVLVRFYTPETSYANTTPVHTDLYDPKRLFNDKETFSLPKKVADSFNKYHSGVHYCFEITKADM